MIERIPPQATEVEESVLGAMMIESEAADIAIGMLRTEDFYKPAHQVIFDSLKELYNQNNPSDLLTVETLLRDKGKLDAVGGLGYLADLTKAASSAANAEYHASIILEKATRRNLITKCSEIMDIAYDQQNDTSYVLDKAQASIFSLTENETGTMRDLNEVMIRVFKHVSEIQDAGRPLGLRTGLDLDEILQGFQNGKLYFIGARPSMGKTALALTIMRRFANDGIKSGILSLETTDTSIGTRLISQVCEIPVDVINSGRMTGEQVDRFSKACETLSKLGMIIDDQAALTIQKVRSKCRLLVKKGAKCVFIDFLTLITGDDTRNKHLEISQITKTLKHISKDLNIPIIALAQLSREIEKRSDKRPQLSDLRESGSIEEDADSVIFLYRPEYYGITTTTTGDSTEGLAEVIIAKNKDGKTGRKFQRFIPEYMRFENFAYTQNSIEQQPVKPPHVPVNDFDYDDMEDDSPF